MYSLEYYQRRIYILQNMLEKCGFESNGMGVKRW
jgi:hypothetical protein